ncbi:MAG: T9SS type A sorting domain-containing protein [Bacteroidetes bacterium]|nr:T9SS type A sorting domain-containing protein [Bacteroidota bacterium]
MKNLLALIKLILFTLTFLSLNQNLFAQNVGISSIVITFDSIPNATITKAGLKYNKHFALSYHLEGANKDVYSHAFKYLNGGTINNVTYPGKFYTNGCNSIPIPFKMSTSIFSMNDAKDTDLHNPSGAYAATYLTWPEIIELYQAGWGIYNQGLTSADTGNIDYLIGRNHSYLKLKTQAATNNGIESKILVNPQGNIAFSSPAFNLGYDAAYRPYVYGVPYLDVTNPSTITDIDSLKMGRTNLIGTESLGKLADSLNAHSSYSLNNWVSVYNKSVTGGSTGYSFDVFKFYIDYIATKYGKDSTDNIWMTSEEEVLDYLTVSKNVTINTEVLGNQLLITFNGTLPTDLRYYALSLLINANVKITGISVNGGVNNSYKGIGYTSGMINLNWDGKVVVSKTVNAETYVSKAESSQSNYDVLIAMDYLNMLDPGQTMQNFRNRLCAIPGAVLPDGWCNCSFSLGNDTVICLGDTITITAPLGVSYEWSTGEITQSIQVSPTQHTQYSVTVYNNQGCYSSDSKMVLVVSNEFATLVASKDTVCVNSCVNIVASGGRNYLWNTGETTPLKIACPDSTKTYSVKVTNAFGCIDNDTITIHTYPKPIIQLSNDTAICQTKCVTLTASGGYQYAWSSGQTTNSIQVCPNVTTTYYVTVTNDKNCSAIDSVTVTVLGVPTISLKSDTSICINDCISLTASGGSSYLWSTGATTASIQVCPTITTKYIVNVLNTAGCSGKDSVTVNVLPLPTLVVSNDTSICINSCVTLYASGGNTYRWTKSGDTTLIGTADSIVVCPSEQTTYLVKTFNLNGCSVTDSVKVSHKYATNAKAGLDTTICIGGTATLIASGGFTYLWTSDDTATIAGYNTRQINVSPLDTTNYYVLVGGNSNGCYASDTVRVNVRPKPIANAGMDTTICSGDCIILTASGGVDYTWNNGTQGASNYVCATANTNYSVTVYDDYGCSNTDTVKIFIAETAPISFSGLSNVYCSTNPASLLEGTPGGGVFEGPGISNNIFYPSIAGVGTHNISYSLVNDNGCLSNTVRTTNVYASPNIFLGNDTTICKDASLTLTVPQGFDNYLWSNGSTSYTTVISGAIAGVGTDTIRLIATQNGCAAFDEIIVTVISCNVGIEDLNKIGIYMYPNPTKGQFNIKFNTQEKNMQLDIINLQGQIIFSEELEDCNQFDCTKSINLSGYNKGLYIVRFSNKNFIQTAKLLIN